MSIVLSQDDGDDIRIKGATDSTLIGNSGSRLLVDAAFSTPPTVNAVPRYSGGNELLGTHTQQFSVPTVESENPTFIVYAQDVVIGSNKSMVSILNALGSGVNIKLREVYLVNTQNTAAAGVIADFRLLRITGHSA